MVYVITGGPGFGKTTVINLLKEKGLPVCEEGARDLISPTANLDQNNGNLRIPLDFEKKIAFRRIEFLESIEYNAIAFSDRGLPDQIAYSWYKNKIPSQFIEEAVRINRYAPVVFVTPLWETVFKGDDIRKESFTDASEIHGYILSAYQKYGYEMIDLPFVSPELRVEFILNFLGI
jgi:predicted ATPase